MSGSRGGGSSVAAQARALTLGGRMGRGVERWVVELFGRVAKRCSGTIY